MNWPAPDPILEAGEDGPAKRAQRANRAAQGVNQDYQRHEDQAAAQLLTRLMTLKGGLQQRLGQEFLTDFKRNSLDSMLSSVDQLIATASKGVADDTKTAVDKAADLGDDNAVAPITAAQLKPRLGLAQADVPLVQAAFGNLVDLLTPPMQQFGSQVKQSVRRVALATDGRQGEINRLRDLIQGKGFDNAAYKAERIIRTELGRTFNEATYTRLVDLSKQFTFIRKCWRCTRDSRTRIGHVQAAAQYGKGNGIPISELFKLAVYDERPGKLPKLIGTALLRFPIDPLVKPEGRIGAAATIMCRCNAFVDFLLAAFAEYTRQQVSLALQGVVPPTPALPPAPPAPAPQPKPTPLIKQPKAVKVKAPKVAKPKVNIGAPILKTTATAAVVPKSGPNGLKVSAHLALRMKHAKDAAAIERALAVLDSVHGDGLLPSIPVTPVPQRGKTKGTGAFYMHNGRGTAMSLGFTSKLLKTAPNMTVFHETGHFLDNKAFGEAGIFGSEGGVNPALPPATKAALEQVTAAMAKSRVYQTLVKWDRANVPAAGITYGGKYGKDVVKVGGYDGPDVKPGEDGVPSNLHRPMVTYMLKSRETFARAYAQYVAVKSGDPAALAELAKAKDASRPAVEGTIKPGDPEMSTPLLSGRKHIPGTWTYPWAWQDDDFAPIQKAFDNLFEVTGWRK